MQQQGQQANFNGKMLEEQVLSRIKHAGYRRIKAENLNFFNTDRWFIQHYYIGDSIYGTREIVDIILYNKDKYPEKLIVEVKWQQITGSVDEKYPFLVLNLKKLSPIKSIVVIDGGGYKPGALLWLKSQIDSNLIGVFELTEFIKWCNLGGI